MRFFHINKIKLLFFLFERTNPEIKSGTRMINTSISMQRSIMANLETRSTYLLESTTRNDVFLPSTNTKSIVKPFDLKFRGEKLKTIRRLILSVRPGSERLRNRRTNRDKLREGRDGKSREERAATRWEGARCEKIASRSNTPSRHCCVAAGGFDLYK